MALTSLVVCADANAVHVLNRLLQDLGTRVELCGDPHLALLRLSEISFDVVVVDCNVGDCKEDPAAMQLIAQVRQTPANHTTAVVALVDSQSDVRKIFAQGANFVLYKPISAERAATSLQAARSLIRNERRSNRRVPVNANASIAYANIDNVWVKLADVSEEGIAILSKQKLPARCKVYFQFSLPGNSSTVRLSGEVMWQDSSGRVGIRFVDLPKTSRRVVSEWLKENLCHQPEMTLSLSPNAAQSQPQVNLAAGLGLLTVSAGDRRNRSRHACSIGADIYRFGHTVPHRCTLTDVSTGGCYVQSSEPFSVGAPVEIVVRANELKLKIEGKVQSRHPGFGMGVQFTVRTEQQRDQVRQLLEWQSAAPKLSLELM
jgi:CheY-like chemotaxis protein